MPASSFGKEIYNACSGGSAEYQRTAPFSYSDVCLLLRSAPLLLFYGTTHLSTFSLSFAPVHLTLWLSLSRSCCHYHIACISAHLYTQHSTLFTPNESDAHTQINNESGPAHFSLTHRSFSLHTVALDWYLFTRISIETFISSSYRYTRSNHEKIPQVISFSLIFFKDQIIGVNKSDDARSPASETNNREAYRNVIFEFGGPKKFIFSSSWFRFTKARP